MFGEVINAPQAVLVCVFCMAMVFIVLIALAGLINLSAWFISAITGRKKRLEHAKQQKAAKNQ